MTNIINRIAAAEVASAANLTAEALRIIDEIIENSDESTTKQDMLNALCDGAWLKSIDAEDQAAVEEAYAFIESVEEPAVRYEIRDAISECGYGLDDRIAECYIDRIELNAANDAEAIAEAKHLQADHDAIAGSLIDAAEQRGESTYDLEESYNNAPCYVAHLFKITLDADGEEIEEPVEC